MASTKPSSNKPKSEEQRPRIALDAVRRMIWHGIGHRIRDKQVQAEPSRESKMSPTRELETSSIEKPLMLSTEEPETSSIEKLETAKLETSSTKNFEISPSEQLTDASTETSSAHEKDMVLSVYNRWRTIEEEKAAIRAWNNYAGSQYSLSCESEPESRL